MIAWGLLDCFLGYQVFRVMVTIWGAIIGAYVGQVVAATLGLSLMGQLIGLLVGALAGGGLAFMLYLAAVFVAGVFFGLTLGILLFAHSSPSLALFAGCGLGLISGFVALKLQKVLLILASSLMGAFRALLALMFFTNRIDWLYYLAQQPKQVPVLIENNAWLLPATLTLATVGALAQFGLSGKDAKKKDRAEH